VEAIGVLEELLRIKKMHFGTNSREVRSSVLIVVSLLDHASSFARSAIYWLCTT
jgi:hypothetical protein